MIEKYGNYQKQSYRNRCYIYGANGPQCLVIPVKKDHGEKTPITKIEIDYSTHWQHIHLKSIQSAYQLSAFYEFYADELIRLISSHTTLLYELNTELLKLMLKWLRINEIPDFTQAWEEDYACDFRQSISPKKRLQLPDNQFRASPYQQVFSDRYGFIPNLSIIDLLFNEGPQALTVLRKSMV
jgi:hypothetical protein